MCVGDVSTTDVAVGSVRMTAATTEGRRGRACVRVHVRVCVCERERENFLQALISDGRLRRSEAVLTSDNALLMQKAEQPVSKTSQLLPGASYLHSSRILSAEHQQRFLDRPFPECESQITAHEVPCVTKGRKEGERRRERETQMSMWSCFERQ